MRSALRREAAPPRAGKESWSTSLGSVRLLFGEGRLGELGALVRELGGHRVLLVSDPGVALAGHTEAALSSLLEAGLGATVFDQVGENPSTAQVETAAQLAREEKADFLVGLGGGSAMDCAKGANFLVTNGGRMEDYWGFAKATKPLLPSVGIPTTAGTGSEAQSYALITQEETHRKMACGDPGARFRAVILDPGLLATVPPGVRAVTGLDALSHAVESYVSTCSNPISRMLAGEAFRRLEARFQGFLLSARDRGVSGSLLLGAHLAGAAIEQSMLGAAHAAANPLTARFGIVHGAAVALMLPAVVRHNGPAVAALYRELLKSAELEPGDDPAETLARRLEDLRAAGSLGGHLEDHGIGEGDLPELARDAAQEWTGTFNPRPMEEGDFLQLYRRVL